MPEGTLDLLHLLQSALSTLEIRQSHDILAHDQEACTSGTKHRTKMANSNVVPIFTSENLTLRLHKFQRYDETKCFLICC